MGYIRDKRLVFSAKDMIRSLIEDLAETGEAVSVRAKELPEEAWAKVLSVSDKSFVIQTISPLCEKDYVPLSSWRFDVNLTGAHLSFVTMSLSREAEAKILMSLPDLLVSGDGRQSYRISVVGDPVELNLVGRFEPLRAALVDASFGGAKVRALEPIDPAIEEGQEVIMSGQHKGIRFERTAIVGWVQGESIGVGMPDVGRNKGDEPWQAFVRSLAYEHVLARLERAA